MEQKKKPKAIIIGAGASGLSSAHYLQQNYGFEIATILEARPIHGGRVKKLEGFADYTIELGGEELYCPSQAYYSLCKEAGATMLNKEEYDEYDEDPETGTMLDYVQFCEKYPRESQIYELLMEDGEGLPQDMSAADYIHYKKFNPAMKYYVEAMLGTENGSTLEKMNARGMSIYEKGQVENFNVHILNNMSHFDVLEKVFAGVLPKVRYNAPVAKIEYNNINDEGSLATQNCQSSAGVVVTCKDGSKYEADYVVCTVPISQLKKRAISFFPDLPQERYDALDRIDMDRVGKLHLKFSHSFWPPDMGNFQIDHKCHMGWVSSGFNRSQNDNVLIFFVAGDQVQKLSDNIEEETKDLLHHLSKIFNVDAESLLLDKVWQDWSQEPFIEGGYSYCCTNYQDNTREVLRKNIKERIFWAGEAYAQTYATINGAVESGKVTAKEIFDVFMKTREVIIEGAIQEVKAEKEVIQELFEDLNPDQEEEKEEILEKNTLSQSYIVENNDYEDIYNDELALLFKEELDEKEEVIEKLEKELKITKKVHEVEDRKFEKEQQLERDLDEVVDFMMIMLHDETNPEDAKKEVLKKLDPIIDKCNQLKNDLINQVSCENATTACDSDSENTSDSSSNNGDLLDNRSSYQQRSELRNKTIC